MSDTLIRVICRNAEIKFTAVCTTELVERARQIHRTLPLATAALSPTQFVRNNTKYADIKL